jgi:hypothetical protein
MNSRLILAFWCSLIFTTAAFGQNWLNPAGGSFGTPTNWSNDGTPLSPVFDLNSVAGYTTSLPNSYLFEHGFAVQTDNVTVDLDGYGFTTSAFSVLSSTGQVGSLTLVGPGTIELYNGETMGSGNLDVGDQGGTGQLIVNDATIYNTGEVTGHFDANGLVVENGGTINLANSTNNTVSNATFNDGSLTASDFLTLGGVSLSNGSSILGFNVTIVGATLDNSTIGASGTGTIEGTVTLSDNAQLEIPDQTVAGTVILMAGTKNLAGNMAMQNGTLSIELNSQVSDMIIHPISQDNGTLDFTLQSGFEPTIGEQFSIFNPAAGNPSERGTFATINVPTLPAGESWNISTLYTNGTISVVPEPISMGMILFGIAGLALRRRG